MASPEVQMGKYFKKSAVVKDEHIISAEHYIRRLMMATGL